MHKETQDMYEHNRRMKESFERWKRRRFSEYDREKHDEFLRDRYERVHNQQFDQHAKEAKDQYHSKNHFTAQEDAQKGPQNSPIGKKQAHSHFRDSAEESNEKSKENFRFEHNSNFIAFFTNSQFRRKFLDAYYEEWLYGIILFGIVSNIFLWIYLKRRKAANNKEKID